MESLRKNIIAKKNFDAILTGLSSAGSPDQGDEPLTAEADFR
jgi:hypothetical protein